MSHTPNFSVMWGVFPSFLKASFGAGKFHLSDEVLELRCSQISASEFSISVTEYIRVGFIFLMFKWEIGEGIQMPKHRCNFICLHFYYGRVLVSCSPSRQLPDPYCCLRWAWATWSNFEVGLNLSGGLDGMTSRSHFQPKIWQFCTPGYPKCYFMLGWDESSSRSAQSLSTLTVKGTEMTGLDSTQT